MIISMFREKAESDGGFNGLQRKMARAMAVHRDLKHVMAREFELGKGGQPEALTKLLLNKKNCVNCLEGLIRSIDGQLKRMAVAPLPRTMPRTMANRVRALSGLTPGIKAVLLPMARSIEADNLALVTAARQNTRLLKHTLNRMLDTMFLQAGRNRS